MVRTTLELDDTVIAVARSRALALGSSIGKEISKLALKGIDTEKAALGSQRTDSGLSKTGRGFVVFNATRSHSITSQMVADALDEF
jgi:hypothetical protein